jgi:site-specific DNA recombinase
MARILGAARLSHHTDASTSIERQTDQITGYAASVGATLVHITADTDVSGKVAPQDRPMLGEWLTDRLGEWDTLVVTKIDRLTRSLSDFLAVIAWCDANGKILVSIGDSFDLSTAYGRAAAKMIATFAELERELVGERRADHTRQSMSQARWDGRAVAPGYRPVKVGDHFELEVDEAKAARIRAMADAVIGGKSARQVGAEFGLDSAGVLSILRNQSLRGYVMHDGQPVRGEDGLPVQREAILDDGKWDDLQARLDRNASPGSGSRKGGAALLLGVARCWTCGQPLYIMRRAGGDRYRHADGVKCNSSRTGKPGSFTAAHLESAVEEELMAFAGDVEMVETVTVPGKGDDLRAQIRRVQEATADLDASYEAGDTTATTYGRMQARLESRLAGYQATFDAMPAEERDGFTRDIPTGKTYRQHWAELDEAGRGAFLRDLGVKLVVRRAVEAGDVTGHDMFATDHDGRGSAVTLMQRGRAQMFVNFGRLRDLAEAARMAA